MRTLLLFFALSYILNASVYGVQAQPLQPWTLRVSGANSEVRSIAWAGDGKTLAFGTDNEIQIWDARTKRRQRIIRFSSAPDQPSGQIMNVSVSPRGTTVSGTFSYWQAYGGIALTDARSGRMLLRLAGGKMYMFWKPRRQLLNGGANGMGSSKSLDTFSLQSYNFHSRRFDKGWELPAPRGLNFVEFSTAASGPSPPEWTLSPDARRGAIALLKIVPIKMKIGDKEYGYARNESRGVLIFDVRTGKHRRILPIFLPSVGGGLQFSPDGRVLIANGRDIESWDVTRSRLRLHLKVKHDARWSAVALSPNNDLLAVGDDGVSDGGPYIIYLWNARNGHLLRELKGHRADVTTLVFSPDGKTLASGSDDGTVKLWRVRASIPPSSARKTPNAGHKTPCY